ncbi:hypothetical protein KKC22_15885, partial [Myxococcota bacterium]|nr:hypothetical protein [Myxococcota bacterium]
DCNGFNFTDCLGTCGDGVIDLDHGEVCDTTALDGRTCASLGLYPGELACLDDCRDLDLSGCGGRCGDQIIQYAQGEICDGQSLDGATCKDLNLFFGERDCDDSCRLTSGDCRDTLLWGTTTRESGTKIFTTSDGGFVLTGYTQSPLDGQPIIGQNDIFVARFDDDGFLLWTRILGSTVYDQAGSVLEDAEGNVYVCGSVEGSVNNETGFGGKDAMLMKISALFGTVLWTRIWGTSANDYCDDLVLSEGKIHAVGATFGSIEGPPSAGMYDLYVTTFDRDGQVLWSRQRGSSNMDSAKLALINPLGQLILVGNTRGSFDEQTNPNSSNEIVVVAYDLDGNHLWTRSQGTTGDDLVYGAAFDAAGNLWISGSTTGTFPNQTNQGNTDAYLLKLSPSGDFSGAWQWGSSADDAAKGVVAAQSGDVWVAGNTFGSLPGQPPNNGLQNLFLTRFSAAGVRGGTRVLGSMQEDIASDLALGEQGLFLTGYASDSINNQPFIGETDIIVLYHSFNTPL